MRPTTEYANTKKQRITHRLLGLDRVAPLLLASCRSVAGAKVRGGELLMGGDSPALTAPRGAFDFVLPVYALTSARPEAGSNSTAPASRAPRVAPSHYLKLGPKRRHGFARSLVDFTKLNFSEPFLSGNEVNLQRAPSHPTRILTAITAV
jgi:hypothetical protein